MLGTPKFSSRQGHPESSPNHYSRCFAAGDPTSGCLWMAASNPGAALSCFGVANLELGSITALMLPDVPYDEGTLGVSECPRLSGTIG